MPGIDEDIYYDLFGDSDYKLADPWVPQPISVYLIATLAFMVGFAICYLIFVP